MKWSQLKHMGNRRIRRGALIRVPARHPYEAIVDFMVFDPQDDERGMGLIVDSGYKAGLILVILPKESQSSSLRSISSKWLKENWTTWGYDDCRAEDVYVCLQGRPLPTELP